MIKLVSLPNRDLIQFAVDNDAVAREIAERYCLHLCLCIWVIGEIPALSCSVLQKH